MSEELAIETMQELIIEKDDGQSIKLYVTQSEAERAITDNEFALHLYKEYARRRIAKNNAMPLKDVPTALIGFKSISSSANSIQENVEDSIIEDDKTLFLWPTKYVHLLLQKYEERMHEFSSGSKRHSKIWESIACDINKVDPMVIVSGTQCQSKMNSLKKMYKKVIDHNNVSGNDRKSWQYFERMDELFRKSGWANPKALASDAGPSSFAPSTDENINNKEPATKRLKTEKALDEFMKQIKQDRQEREKIKEEKKVTILREVQNEKQKQHEEKMDIMKKFCEAISGKKLF